MPQGFGPSRQIEMTQILLHDGRHGHAKSGRKILRRHRLLFYRVCQKANEASSQVLGVPWLIKLNRQFFPIRHLPEIRQVRAHHGNTVGARQVGNAAATCR